MEDNITTLNKLRSIVVDKNHKAQKALRMPNVNHNRLFPLDFLNAHSQLLFASFLKMIQEVEEHEKEQSRIDWKEGYMSAVSDFAKLLGVDDKDILIPKEDEMNEIEKDSLEYIKRKFKSV